MGARRWDATCGQDTAAARRAAALVGTVGPGAPAGCDTIAQLEEKVRIAREFTPLSQGQMAKLNELAAPVAEQSLFFRFTDRSGG